MLNQRSIRRLRALRRSWTLLCIALDQALLRDTGGEAQGQREMRASVDLSLPPRRVMQLLMDSSANAWLVSA